MKYYRPKVVSKSGWTEWQAPRMSAFKLWCCDCGLVHDFQFMVIKDYKKTKKGYGQGDKVSSKKYRVLMRARRNARSTAAVRRHKK